MKTLYIQDVVEMLNIDKIEEYNKEFVKIYPSWRPFVTKDNFKEYLENMNNMKQGIGNDGIKEMFYWLIENNKIIGSGSIRLNPEINEKIETYHGHIFYQIIPSKRKQGYGTIICHLLLEKMHEFGYKEAIITCYDTNIGSSNIIETNGGQLIETVAGDGEPNSEHLKTKRYKINIDESLKAWIKKNNYKESI